MKYRIEINKKARKFIASQQPKQQKRIIEAIYKLPDGEDIKRLVGYNNVYRLRIGNYRVVYEIHDDILLIIVVNAGNRGDIYKQL